MTHSVLQYAVFMRGLGFKLLVGLEPYLHPQTLAVWAHRLGSKQQQRTTIHMQCQVDCLISP